LAQSEARSSYVVVFSLVGTIRGTKLKVDTPATTLTKIALHQINCNVKEMLWGL